MTKDQLKQQAQELLDGGRMLEAGFIVNVLMHTRSEATAEELFVGRSAFFFGARYMLESMLAVQAKGVPDRVLRKVITNLRTELENFGAELEANCQDGALH